MTRTKWTEVSEERYDEMLGVLPPAIQTGMGFLVGEPNDHATCSVTGNISPNFQPFAQIGDRFFEAFECLTIAEFKLVTPASVLENLRPAVAEEPHDPRCPAVDGFGCRCRS